MVFEGLNCRHFHETTTSIDTDFLPVHSCLDPSKVKNVHEFREQAVTCLFLLVQKFIRILRWSRADVNQLNTQLKIKYLLPSAIVNQFILISLARYFLLQSTSQPVHPYNVSGLRAYDFLIFFQSWLQSFSLHFCDGICQWKILSEGECFYEELLLMYLRPITDLLETDVNLLCSPSYCSSLTTNQLFLFCFVFLIISKGRQATARKQDLKVLGEEERNHDTFFIRMHHLACCIPHSVCYYSNGEPPNNRTFYKKRQSSHSCHVPSYKPDRSWYVCRRIF